MARKSRKHLHDGVTATEYERRCYNAAGYVRLSGDDTDRRGDSLENQQNIIENFVATAPDVRLVEIYSDNRKTGTNFERPGFKKLLDDIERGNINCIIVKDLTRFGRNAIDTGYYLEKYLPLRGIRFISITDAHDSINSDGGILLPLKNIISESYALDLSRKQRAVYKQNIQDGCFIGRIAPYGYMKAPNDCHQLIINEETAPVIRQIFSWAGESVSPNEITKRLTASGIPSPSHYNFSKGIYRNKRLLGTVYWKSTKVREILDDRVYAGDLVQGKTRTENNREIRLDPSEWVCVENTHEPIIAREEFMRIQKTRQAVYDMAISARETSTPYTQNIFKSKVFCAGCGYALARYRYNKEDGSYAFRCVSQSKYGKDACTSVSIKESDLKSNIISTLHRQAEAILGSRLSLEKDASALDNSEKELREIYQGLDKDGRILKSLYESMVSGLITQAEFVQMKKDYEMKIELLHKQADAIRNSRHETKKRSIEFNDFADTVSSVTGNDSLTAEIIDKLIQKIHVSPDKSLDISFRFMDEFREVQYA